MARHLREKGIQVAAALLLGPLRALKARMDLRLHRKIVVIDNETAYTGSLNLVDPRFFKQDAGVGEWVDAMVRITGPAVYLLSALFAWDWELETNSGPVALPEIKKQADDTQPGTADVQVIPSGPGIYGGRIYHLLMMTLYAAQSELVITTPYFSPTKPFLTSWFRLPDAASGSLSSCRKKTIPGWYIIMKNMMRLASPLL